MTDIAELFARDPQNLTKQDIVELVTIYREKRYQFNLGDKTAGSTKKIVKENGPKIRDLSDLIGEI